MSRKEWRRKEAVIVILNMRTYNARGHNAIHDIGDGEMTLRKRKISKLHFLVYKRMV